MATLPEIKTTVTTNPESIRVPLYTTKKDFYHISFANECQICLKTCVKPRRLPCEHEFCKACLKEYLGELDNEEEKTYFPCPSCNHSVPKPHELPKSKWTKAFKIDKRTLFYTQTDETYTSDIAGKTKTNDASENTESSAILRKNATSFNRKFTGCSRRTGAMFTRFDKTRGFNSNLASDTTGSIYWGGDITTKGDIIIADWYNKTVKVFSTEGKYVNCIKLKHPPLDLTVVNDNTILVSFGSVARSFDLLQYEDGKLRLSDSVPLHGNLYSTTRCGKKCLGIYESNDGIVTLVTIGVGGKVRILDLGQSNLSLSSSSGITYNQAIKKIYCTERKNCVCIDSDGNLQFERSYPYLETDHYALGSVTCDNHGNVYLASEHCVLRVNTNGNLVNVMPTKLDPYHVMVTSSGNKLVILGKSARVECYTLNNDT